MTDADQQSQSKDDLRSQMKSRLAAMTPEELHEGSVGACARLVQLDVFRNAATVMLYMPLASEVDLSPIAIRCFQVGKTVCVPKVDWQRRDMMAVEVSSFDDRYMDIDEHGLRAPRDGRPTLPSLIDLVVVPGLAFDDRGNRLGRGGGYYDRFLPRLRPVAATIALAFDLQIVDVVPADERDMGVRTVVTDRRVIHPSKVRARRG